MSPNFRPCRQRLDALPIHSTEVKEGPHLLDNQYRTLHTEFYKRHGMLALALGAVDRVCCGIDTN